jgi:GntR family transcriptional regulator
LARHNKWEDIAASLRKRIVSGELKPGQDFPSTLELMEEFKVYASTIQNAINALIREGLILSPGSGSKRRFVRPLVERSTRPKEQTV